MAALFTRVEAETLHRRLNCVHEVRGRRKLGPALLPALRAHDTLFLETLSLEQIVPAIRARIEEELEIRVERELILRRKDRQLDAPIPSEKHLQPRDLFADVVERQRLALPAAARAKIVESDVHRGRQMLRQRLKEVDDALGVGDDVRREVAVLRREREGVDARPETAPNGCFR